MIIRNFICCPRCGGNTHVKMNVDTQLRNFPLWCKLCRRETLIDAENGVVKCCRKEA